MNNNLPDLKDIHALQVGLSVYVFRSQQIAEKHNSVTANFAKFLLRCT